MFKAVAFIAAKKALMYSALMVSAACGPGIGQSLNVCHLDSLGEVSDNPSQLLEQVTSDDAAAGSRGDAGGGRRGGGGGRLIGVAARGRISIRVKMKHTQTPREKVEPWRTSPVSQLIAHSLDTSYRLVLTNTPKGHPGGYVDPCWPPAQNQAICVVWLAS